jgi:hypothetical protein
MRALAELGGGTHRSSEIAENLKMRSQSAAPVRSALIRKGMIYSLLMATPRLTWSEPWT